MDRYQEYTTRVVVFPFFFYSCFVVYSSLLVFLRDNYILVYSWPKYIRVRLIAIGNCCSRFVEGGEEIRDFFKRKKLFFSNYWIIFER